MALRTGTTLGALLLAFAFSQIAAAQVAAPKKIAPPAGNQPQAAPVDQASADAAWRDLLAELKLLRGELQVLQNSVSVMQDGFARQVDLNDRLQQQLDALNTRVELVAQGGSSAGAEGINFVRSIQDDPKLAGDFQKVVQGKVIFENKTGEAQRIFINGAEWEVITGRSSMMVPYGRVTFHTRATTDGTLTQFNAENWKREGDLFVLNVPLELTPTAESVNR